MPYAKRSFLSHPMWVLALFALFAVIAVPLPFSALAPDVRPVGLGAGLSGLVPPVRQSKGYAAAPVYFVENHGQQDPRVSYYAQGKDTSVFFTRSGLVINLLGPAGEGGGATPSNWALALDFVKPNASVTVQGQRPWPGTVSYFKGAPEQWVTGLPTYGAITYGNVWPGTDLQYRSTTKGLKYWFTIAPGSDPSKVLLAYRGADNVSLTPNGEIEASTPVRSFRDPAPYAYQDVGGVRREVPVSYALLGSTTDGGTTFGFQVGDYDPTLPLIIDPTVIVYAGYIGGSSAEEAFGLAVDSSGNAYVVGETTSSEASFPVTVGPSLVHSIGTDYDVYVAKVNSAGSLVYAGYIGGSQNDYGNAIAIDSSGNAYIAGHTESHQTDGFPVTVGPDLTYNGSSFDGFVAKVNASGTALVYAGYIGGAQNEDRALGIAVDAAGAAYVVGQTNSNQSSFPVAIGPDLTYIGGSSGGPIDGFIAKVKPDGTSLEWCGYIGGADNDQATSAVVDSAGQAYVTGNASSSESTFPVTVGPDLTYNGGEDAFVAKVKADGSGFIYLGYIGGAKFDSGYGIAIDGSGAAYVAVGPDLTYNGDPFNSTGDAFVAKVKADGTGLVYAGYIGGAQFDRAATVAVDSSGNAYIAGQTASQPSDGFPVSGGPDDTFNGGNDAFVAKVNAAGDALVWSGYIGGAGADAGYGIGLDSSGNVYVAGRTASTEASFPVLVGPDLTYNGGTTDAFVAKLTQGSVSPPAATPTPTPASTATPTPTPTPTKTPTPTPTPTPTLAPGSTPTATGTPTPTPTPKPAPAVSGPALIGLALGVLAIVIWATRRLRQKANQGGGRP